MPPITRLFIKTSLVYLIVALLVGLLLAADRYLALPAWLPLLTPVYFHLFMVGWVTQLIAGVAYWMFPKFTRTQPRGHDLLAWITYGGLNLGLILRAVAEPAMTYAPAQLWGVGLALAALLQWLGGLAFVANTWPRVKEK
jgi:hypothetical protein